MNNKIKYTIEIDKENRELINWLNEQENLNEFIPIMLEKAMINERSGRMSIISDDELDGIINSLDDSFWNE